MGLTQGSLDFLDVDILGDRPVFIDPTALLALPSAWGRECVTLVQDFFHKVLELIHNGQHDEARELLSRLREPNETHLGYSRGRARGRALGLESANRVWDALRLSEAVRTGLLEDLEDTILMVPGIAEDIVSDITTNIIRQPLIHYTEMACEEFGIPIESGVPSGPLWDPENKRWFDELVELPIPHEGKKLLLVPKVIVRKKMTYNTDDYFTNYLLPFLREYELQAGSALVRVLRDGRRIVTNKSLIEKYGAGKTTIVRETRNYPEVLARYRTEKRTRRIPPMLPEAFRQTIGTPEPDLTALIDELAAISPGTPGANLYHRSIEAFFTALFYPALVNPHHEFQIHEGRKRIDILYVNAASTGFFHWLGLHHEAPHVIVECKNYSGDPANPELDQLSGRFSHARGRVGLLVCRHIQNKPLFLERCRDTARDDRGFIIPLDDDDLRELADAGRAGSYHSQQFTILNGIFDHLTM